MKALLNRRNAINLSLVVTLGFGPALTYLQASDNSSRSSDLVIKSLHAKKSGDVKEYQRLLGEAKKQLSTTENMTPESQKKTGHLIDDLIARPPTVVGTTSTGDADADILRDNPRAREVLYDMAMGRLDNGAMMINSLTQDVAGMTGTAFDQAQQNAATLDLMNPTVDLVGKVLTLIGVMKIDPKVDLSIIKRNDPGYNPDAVARGFIAKNVKFSAAAAGGIGMGSSIVSSQLVNKPILNSWLNAAGLSMTGYILLKQNTAMMQDIAAIYGEPIRDATALEAFAVSTLYLAQIYSSMKTTGTSAAEAQAAATQVGSNFALMKVPAFAGKARMFFLKLLHSPKVQQMVAAAKPGAINVANKAGIPADQQAPPGPITPDPTVPAPAPAPAPGPVDPTTPTVPTTTNKFPHRAALMTILSGAMIGARDAAVAAIMTEAIGHAAMDVARAAAKKSQQQRDQAFYKFMASSAGEQFINLLITASQASDRPARDLNIESSRDPRMLFMHNVARMAHICSAPDINKANVRAKALGSKAGKDIFVYECAGRTSVQGYNRMRMNFLNFNGIMTNEQSMTALRLTAKANRLKMAQLVNQFQRLDGDRDPKEATYFDNVVRKLLGLDDPSFSEYFQQYDSHISDNHGPRPDAQSPTGFIVEGSSPDAPFSEKRAGIGPNDSIILDSDLVTTGSTATPINGNTNTSTGGGYGTGGYPGQYGSWPPLTPVPPGPTGPTCNPNIPGSCNNPNQVVPAPGATRSWLHIDNLQGV